MSVKRLNLLLVVLVTLALVVACGAKSEPTQAPATEAPKDAAPTAESEAGEYTTEGKVLYNVGFLKGHPVIRLMTLGFIIGAEELGYEYKLLQSDGADYARFVQDLEQANAEGASAVVGFIGDPSQGPAVAALGESGIPFCSAHFPQEEGEYPGMNAWAAADTVAYAEAAARAVGDELRERGVTEGSLAITQGNFNTVENLVAETFAATIEAEYPEFTPLESQEEGFDPPVAIAKASAIIQANPDIVGALSTTGAGPTTWARAAEENGLADGEIVIVSMDYTRPNLDLVKDGKVFGLVGQPLVAEFRECVYLMDKELRGEEYDYANPMAAPIITLDDLDEYYALNDKVEEYLGAAPEAEAEDDYTTEGKVLYNVGFLKGHPVIRLMTLGFIIGAEELGYEYKLLQSDGADYARFVQDLEQANAEGASAVVGFIGDPSQGPAVAALGEAGIPFCSAHFPQEEGDYPGMNAWAAADTVAYAEAAARAVGDELRERGVTEGSLAITQGNFNTVENLVAETFAATIEAEYPEFTPLESQEEGFDPPVAIAKASAIIQANPDIVGALSTTGAGPTTWARAAEENGLADGEIVIVSMDYTRPNLDLVKDGKVFGLVGQPLVAEFRECVYLMDKELRGEEYDYANPMAAPIITLDDLDEYYALNDRVEEYLGAAPEAEAEDDYTTEGKVLYNVGFLKGHPVIRLMTLGFIIGAEELGYEYKLLLSDGADYARFVQDLEQANAEGASAVVGFIGDPSQGPAVAALGESGIPFCSAHFPQEEGDYPGMNAWAAADTVAYAEAAARAVGDELRERGVTEGSLAITQGNFNTVENLVAETFAATIEAEYPEFTPLESQEEGFDPPVAIAKASAIIQANPDIVGALSTTGAGPTTWARAAEENGLADGEIVIVSMDYTRPNLDLVKDGKVFGLVGQPLVAEFRECVYLMDKELRGEEYDYANPMEAPIITIDDLDLYYELNDRVEEYLGAAE